MQREGTNMICYVVMYARGVDRPGEILNLD